ncbi:unnamed protein product [Didymodactylos carnosus]|nr:unnamed protein product [Didymodactylos carnosus]CAF4008057.1 unnamed protein product [Didymodactylos carnosus]
MDVLLGDSNRYNIPQNHFEQSYITNCTDGKELERIYKVLKSKDERKFQQLEDLILARIEKVEPHSTLLCDEKSPLNTSFSPEEELKNVDNSLNTMSRRKKETLLRYPNRTSTQTQNKSDDIEKQTAKKNNVLLGNLNEGQTSAEEWRILGNTAYSKNQYQLAYEYYTNSLKFDKKNPSLHNNRLKLNDYDGCITDCNEVLCIETQNIKGLYRRAKAFFGKKMYNEAINDLERLLFFDSKNNEAKLLLTIITTKQNEDINVQQQDGKRPEIIDDDVEILSEVYKTNTSGGKCKITAVKSDDDIVKIGPDGKIMPNTNHDKTTPIIYSNNQQLYTESLADDDSTPLRYLTDNKDSFNKKSNSQKRYTCGNGVEADNEGEDDDNNSLNSDGLGENSRSPRSMNVSPITTPRDQIDQSVLLFSQIPDDNNNESSFEDRVYNPTVIMSHSKQNENHPNIYDDERQTTPKINPSRWNNTFITVSSADAPNDNDDFDDNSGSNDGSTISFNDAISKSNFSPQIQHWLRETAYGVDYLHSLEIERYKTPWSREKMPWNLDQFERYIKNSYRQGNYKNTIEACKKMLKNGLLDYHCHVEHIIEILWKCADSYAKLNDHQHSIQFTSETLQFNIIHGESLMCRAKAFQNENFLIYAYLDYSKIQSADPNYQLASNFRKT